jgi:hypothetical protein
MVNFEAFRTPFSISQNQNVETHRLCTNISHFQSLKMMSYWLSQRTAPQSNLCQISFLQLFNIFCYRANPSPYPISIPT